MTNFEKIPLNVNSQTYKYIFFKVFNRLTMNIGSINKLKIIHVFKNYIYSYIFKNYSLIMLNLSILKKCKSNLQNRNFYKICLVQT